MNFLVEERTIISVYKHPHFPKKIFLECLKNRVNNFTKDVVFVGDINLDMKRPENNDVSILFAQKGFHSLLDFNFPSRNSGSHIDVCFSNFADAEAFFYESYYSDHKPICILLK